MAPSDLALAFHAFLGEFSLQGVSPDIWVPMVKTHVALQVAWNANTLWNRSDKNPWYPHCPPATHKDLLQKSHAMPGCGVDLQSYYRNTVQTLQTFETLGDDDLTQAQEEQICDLFQNAHAVNMLLRGKVAMAWDQVTEHRSYVKTPAGEAMSGYHVVCPWKTAGETAILPLKEDNSLLGKPGTAVAKVPPAGRNMTAGEIDEELENADAGDPTETFGPAANRRTKPKKGAAKGAKKKKLTPEEQKQKRAQ